MKYHQDLQHSFFAQEELENKVREFRLNPLVKLMDWIDFERFRSALEMAFGYNRTVSVTKRNGRPPFDVILMFKILILQSFYNLSDDQVEYQINDRISFRQFLGLTSSCRIPDAKTIWLFRDKLRKNGALDRVFSQLNAHLAQRGVIVNKGQLIDASFVEVPRPRNSREENAHIKETGEAPVHWSDNKKRQKDTDARWTKKRDERHCGYKNHVLVDRRSKLITSWKLTDAAQADNSQVAHVLKDWWRYLPGQGLWADSAYVGSATQEVLARYGMKGHINERGYRNHPLTAEQKQLNRAKSKSRARVEHVFAFITNSMNGMESRLRSFERNKVAVGMKNFTYNLCRLTQLGVSVRAGTG